jgi:hypothetical protein
MRRQRRTFVVLSLLNLPVQILTHRCDDVGSRVETLLDFALQGQVLSLLALLVQKYKY